MLSLLTHQTNQSLITFVKITKSFSKDKSSVLSIKFHKYGTGMGPCSPNWRLQYYYNYRDNGMKLRIISSYRVPTRDEWQIFISTHIININFHFSAKLHPQVWIEENQTKPPSNLGWATPRTKTKGMRKGLGRPRFHSELVEFNTAFWE